MPLLGIGPIRPAERGAGPWVAVFFTSAKAVGAVAAHRRFSELADLPVYTVGRRTQAAAAAAGFTAIMSADGDVSALVSLIASKPPVANSPLLYCAGEDRAGDLAGALRLHGLRVETALVYRASMVAELTPDVRAAFAAGAVYSVLHYSARTPAALVVAALAGVWGFFVST